MIYHGIEMGGEFICEKLDFLPSWTSKDTGRLVYLINEKILYVGTNSTWQAAADASNIDHNSTAGIQGGANGELYHLDSTSYTSVIELISGWGKGSLRNIRIRKMRYTEHVTKSLPLQLTPKGVTIDLTDSSGKSDNITL